MAGLLGFSGSGNIAIPSEVLTICKMGLKLSEGRKDPVIESEILTASVEQLVGMDIAVRVPYDLNIG